MLLRSQKSDFSHSIGYIRTILRKRSFSTKRNDVLAVKSTQRPTRRKERPTKYMRHRRNALPPKNGENSHHCQTRSDICKAAKESTFQRREFLNTTASFRSSKVTVVDVEIEESLKTVTVRYHETDGRKSKHVAEFEELKRKLKTLSGNYRLKFILITEIPVIEFTASRIGSKFGNVDQCLGAIVSGGVERILTSSHGVTLGQSIWFEGIANGPNGIRPRIRGKVEIAEIVHWDDDGENSSDPKTVDAALISFTSPVSDKLCQTVNHCGDEMGISSTIEDAELTRTVVKVCNQESESRFLGRIICTDKNFMNPELYKCIVIEPCGSIAESFHGPGESGLLIAYEPTLPLPYTLRPVAMLIARYKMGGRWYSLAVPLQRTLDHFSRILCAPVYLMPTLYKRNRISGQYEVPNGMLS